MKLKSFFIAAIASVVAFAGCQQKEDVYSKEPSVELSQKTFELTKDAQSFTFTIAATRDWKVETTADWIVFEPSEGAASLKATTITATVTSNEGKNRTATVNVKAGLASDAISVTQEGPQGGPDPIVEGDGTLAKPYTASQAHAVAAALADGATTPEKVYVRGIIHKIASKHADGVSQYGNGSFYISDSGEASDDDFYCFQVYYLGGKKFTSADQVKVGDDVIIYGQLTNYSGTYETVGKGAAYVYSLNGETDGGGDVPPVTGDAEETTVSDFIAKADTNTEYILTGKVSGLTNASFKGFDLTDATGTITIAFPANFDEWYSKMSNGGTVKIQGKYEYYAAKDQHEMSNGTILSFTAGDGGDGGDEGGDVAEPTNVTPITIAEFLTKTPNTTDWYQLKGKIVSIASTVYGNLTIEDETGSVYVYGLTSKFCQSNDKSFDSIGLAVTDEVVINTLVAEHNGALQAGGNIPAFIVSFTKGEGEKPDEGLTGTKYVLVKEAPEDWSGNYIIAYNVEGSNTVNIFNGADAEANYITAERDGDVITASNDVKLNNVVIAAMQGGYSIKARGGNYIGGDSTKNTIVLKTDPVLNTLSLDGNGGVLVTSDTSVLRFNKATTNGNRFRYYKAASYDKQQAVLLYKLVD